MAGPKVLSYPKTKENLPGGFDSVTEVLAEQLKGPSSGPGVPL